MSNSDGALAPINKVAYPFPAGQGGGQATSAADDARTYFDALSRAEDGFFPIGVNGQWHGGVHFGRETGTTLDQDGGLRCIADGEVIAYRIDDAYPTVEYSSRAPAKYSTGFVLVRHRLQLPPAPRASEEAAGDDVASQPAEPSLVLYSLYMHLQDWQGYAKDTESTRPDFWGDAKEYVVGNKARDTEGKLAPGEIGLRVRDDNHRPIALLPRGTRLTLGAAVASRSGFHEISGITLGDTAPPGQHTGRVYLPELDQLSMPSATGTVVVLPEPTPIKAGDLVGHLGQYQRHGDMHPLSSSGGSRPLAQVDVFSGDDLEGFIRQSRARDSQLDATHKTLLHIQPGTQFAQPAEPDIELTSEEAALCIEGGAGKRWSKGTRGTLQTVERSTLTGFISATRMYANGHVFLAAVRPHDGSELTLEQYNALPAADKASYSQRKVLVPSEGEIWLDGRLANSSNLVQGPARAWSDFPLKLANTTGPAVTHSRVLRLKSAETVTCGEEGGRWFRAIAGGPTGTVDGWVRESGHPNAGLCSPWAWPGFVLMDTGALQPKDLYARAITRGRQALASEQGQLESLTQSAEQSPLFDTLCDAIDVDGKDGITPLELRRALGKPWLAQALSRLVIRHHSEWAGPMDRWDGIDELIPQARKKDWAQEKGRIEALQFWDDVGGKVKLPTPSGIHHLHPVGLISNFAPDCDCRCLNIEKFVLNYKSRHGEFPNSPAQQLDTTSETHLRVLADGIVKYYTDRQEQCFIPHVAYMLATARHETLWNRVYFEPRTEGGSRSYFDKYDPVLAKSKSHQARAKSMENTEEGDGYRYRGRGYVQLTWKVNYRRCGEHLGIDLVTEPHLALQPEYAAGCMIYGMFSGIFTGRRITQYLNKTTKDYFNARRIINGTDKAGTIRAYAELFEEILEASRC